MTQPGWYQDPNDPYAELYWTGAQWSGRRPRAEGYPGQQAYPGQAVYPPVQPFVPRKTMGVGKVLAITAACILIAVIAFVGYAVATAPKSEFERCVRDAKSGSLSEKEVEDFCQNMQDLEKWAPK